MKTALLARARRAFNAWFAAHEWAEDMGRELGAEMTIADIKALEATVSGIEQHLACSDDPEDVERFLSLADKP